MPGGEHYRPRGLCSVSSLEGPPDKMTPKRDGREEEGDCGGGNGLDWHMRHTASPTMPGPRLNGLDLHHRSCLTQRLRTTRRAASSCCGLVAEQSWYVPTSLDCACHVSNLARVVGGVCDNILRSLGASVLSTGSTASRKKHGRLARLLQAESKVYGQTGKADWSALSLSWYG